ncbi:protein kinase [Myxococcota bacterium]|nr:protein kinase [Myxococcota bacterium]
MSVRPIPDHIGPYRVLRFLGQGGCGQVFLALLERGDGFRRPVALKRLLPEASADPGFERDLRREARVGALISHPNVVQVYDQFRLEDDLYLVMEFVDGETLSSLLTRHPHGTPPDIALDLLRELLAGLHHLHSLRDVDGHPLGLVHRDLKPGNLMLARTGHLKIMDLGIARADLSTDATRGDAIKGSWRYMAPEQARGEEIDQRVDVFAAGAMLFQLLTGGPLCGQKELGQLIDCARDGRHLESAPRLDALPAGLAALVRRATAPDRDERLPSATAFAEAVRAVQRGPGHTAETTARLRDLLPPPVEPLPRHSVQASGSASPVTPVWTAPSAASGTTDALLIPRPARYGPSDTVPATPAGERRDAPRRAPPWALRGIGVVMGVALTVLAARPWWGAGAEAPTAAAGPADSDAAQEGAAALDPPPVSGEAAPHPDRPGAPGAVGGMASPPAPGGAEEVPAPVRVRPASTGSKAAPARPRPSRPAPVDPGPTPSPEEAVPAPAAEPSEVTVTSFPSGAAIRVNGKPIGIAGQDLWLGEVEIRPGDVVSATYDRGDGDRWACARWAGDPADLPRKGKGGRPFLRLTCEIVK